MLYIYCVIYYLASDSICLINILVLKQMSYKY